MQCLCGLGWCVYGMGKYEWLWTMSGQWAGAEWEKAKCLCFEQHGLLVCVASV
jgi:hypothetical protein